MAHFCELVFFPREGPTEMWHQICAILPPRKPDLVIRFLRGAQRLNPPRLHFIPSWDLGVVLQALQQNPFDLSALSLKTALLTKFTSVKRAVDLQALSVNGSCLKFGPADSYIVLRPRPGYVPKVPTTPFRDQVVTLQAIPSRG
ncbi:hypothetical protein M9458_034943, partial [Cirrhinus mrigala]